MPSKKYIKHFLNCLLELFVGNSIIIIHLKTKIEHNTAGGKQHSLEEHNTDRRNTTQLGGTKHSWRNISQLGGMHTARRNTRQLRGTQHIYEEHITHS